MKKIKLIALIAALIVALGVYMFLKEIGKPEETPRTAVVVAAVDIPENTMITGEMIELQEIATEALLQNHVRDPKSVIGMVTSGNIYAGEQVVTSRLVRVGAEVDESKTLAYKLDEGMRAITINMSGANGLANMVKPGNRVDILMNYTFEREIEADADSSLAENGGEEEKTETEQVRATRLLLQNVQVLAVDNVLSREGTDAAYTTVTLQLSPEDAAKLSFAEFTSNLRLVMRSTLDNEIVEETEIELDTIRGDGEEATAP